MSEPESSLPYAPLRCTEPLRVGVDIADSLLFASCALYIVRRGLRICVFQDSYVERQCVGNTVTRSAVTRVYEAESSYLLFPASIFTFPRFAQVKRCELAISPSPSNGRFHPDFSDTMFAEPSHSRLLIVALAWSPLQLMACRTRRRRGANNLTPSSPCRSPQGSTARYCTPPASQAQPV